jgi:uncharacterized membrane protein
VLAGATVLAAVWTAGAVLAPWLESNHGVIGSLLRLVYRPGCHQLADRCFDLGYGPFAVCSRCIGLYVGGTFGLLSCTLAPRLPQPHVGWLVVFLVPTVADWILGVAGLASSNNWLRFALAAPLGFTAAVFVGHALREIVRRNSHPEAPGSGTDSVG